MRSFSRGELQDRWDRIAEAESSATDPSEQAIIRRQKEEWFSDSFNYLIQLPDGEHIWCGYSELMGPLLEAFHNYYKDDLPASPLKLLWKRISQELRSCTHCISQHHEAQQKYSIEFESDTVGPLLDVLQTLDEERVTEHLKLTNKKIAAGEHSPSDYSDEVISTLFEVLMFPRLLDDELLVNEFIPFIEAVDESHELTLAGNQQYPVIFSIQPRLWSLCASFLKSEKVRSIGLRLAGGIGKLRKAAEIEPLQPLLKKCISMLEFEISRSTMNTPRPRLQLEHITIWLGIKSLLVFLEPPAFEEGVLERYPVFVSIVLNHISDDTVEFTHAVVCLRVLFEMLGCKLWLKTTFSPSVMRNTLLGQCFHTRNEKSHKEIFDLFLPFLESLEALQDGEHEKQRRHLLYFLLYQVTQSSNFSLLMRKKACKIALLIVDRGYKMNPPCPPFECSHMWGPFLLCSLKDSALHSSLRQPAFDLVHTIIVSDTAALVSWRMKLHSCTEVNAFALFNDDEDDDPFTHDAEEKETSCWTEFNTLSKLTSRECNDWMCIPLIWFNVLAEMNPSSLPISFSKAVIWALSRFSIMEAGNGNDMTLWVKDWIFSYAGSISHSFEWGTPKGCDDGGDGKLSRNSVRVSSSWEILMRILKRCAAQFILQLEQGELQKQWAWEPSMAESLILLLMDPNDNVRQVDRIILEHFSQSRSLVGGLQFLCSSGAALSAMFLGLRYAFNMVLADAGLSNFQNLHHLFFIVQKLLKEAVASLPNACRDNPDESSKLSCGGGFLWQPLFSAPYDTSGHTSVIVDVESWNKMCCLLPGVMWPAIMKCIAEGKAFIDDKKSQMTCVRLMEVLPVIFEKLRNSELVHSASSKLVIPGPFDFKWLHDLIDWGKSSLLVIKKHWKQCLVLLLNLFKGFSLAYSTQVIGTVEELVSRDADVVTELQVPISCLSVSLCTDAAHTIEKRRADPDYSSPQNSLLGLKEFDAEVSTRASAHMHVSDAVSKHGKQMKDEVIVLSDDEADKINSSTELDGASCTQSCQPVLDQKVIDKDILTKDYGIGAPKKVVGDSKVLPQAGDSCMDPGTASCKNLIHDCEPPDSFDTKNLDSSRSSAQFKPLSDIDKTFKKDSIEYTEMSTVEKAETVIQKLVHAEGEPITSISSSEGRQPSMLSKFAMVIPRRQLIQLGVSSVIKGGNLRKQECIFRRLRPVRLDDWYKPILEVDYFSIVGLAADNNDESAPTLNLEEVPTYFRSLDHYVEIFRPLVLEEFKAQLKNSYMESFSSDEMYSDSLRIISVERIDDFHVIRCVSDTSDSSASKGFYENDLVLLTKEPFRSAFQGFHVVGKVERREKDNKSRSNVLVIRFYFSGGSTRLTKARRLLTERSKWCITRIMSITSQVREFQALSSLNDIPILPVILNPCDLKANNADSRNINLGRLPQPMQQKLRSSFNDSQLQAINIAIERSDTAGGSQLSLIQGPPGTGKTKTIVAIVSALLALNATQKIDKQKAPGSSGVREGNLKRLSNQSVVIARAWQDAALAMQLAKEGENMGIGSDESFKRKRMLICAQSNAAVDELVSRISRDGLYGSDGLMYRPYLVRTGNAKTVHPNSMPFFIDTLVEQRLAEQKMNECSTLDDSNLGSNMLRSKLEKLVERIQFFEAKRAKFKDAHSELETRARLGDMAAKDGDLQDMSEAEIEGMLRRLNADKKAIYQDLSIAHARERKTSEEIRSQKLRLRKSIIREAEILVTTLSGCGGDIYTVCSESISSNRFGRPSEEFLFDTVVIDEAAQALEPATLIPLQLLKSNGTKCIMVGDPKQLPATVLSDIASKFLFECSMFERLQRARYPVTMLTTQYRMHPEICQFPSLHFYERKLLNGHDAAKKFAPFHKTMFLRPYVFFDVSDGLEHRGTSAGGLSFSNRAEADVVVQVLRFLKKRYPSEFLPTRIGIISPYKSQVSLLRTRFTDAFGSVTSADVEFNTVDGFQGREIDILILSTVRASEPSCEEYDMSSSVIGFVADVRRMNVALTRAKLSLWIVGNARTLQSNLHWASLLSNAKERNLIISVRRPYETFFRSNSSISGNIMTSKEKECGRKSVSQESEVEVCVTEEKVKESSALKSMCTNVDDLDSCHSYEHGRPLSLNSECNASRPAEQRGRFSIAEKSREHMIKRGSHGSSKHGRLSHGSKCDASRPAEQGRKYSVTERREHVINRDNRENETYKRRKERALNMERYDKSKINIDSADAPHEADGNRSVGIAGAGDIKQNRLSVSPSTGSTSGAINKPKETKSGGNSTKVTDQTDACNEICSAAGTSNTSCLPRSNDFGKRSMVSPMSQSWPCDRGKKDGNQVSTYSVNNPLIARKRQRDAVEALLPSALISSRKPEISMAASRSRRSPSPSCPSRVSSGSTYPTQDIALSSSQSQQRPVTATRSRVPLSHKKEPGSIDIKEEWEAFKELVREQRRK